VRGAILAAATLVLFTACEGNSAETPPLSGEPKDGGILFSSKRDGDFEIYLMDPDGSDVRQLTRNESQGENEADDGSPSWSPDGRRIAFTSTSDHEGDGFDSEELYVMEADGAGQTRLTENESGEGGPSWSPDGEWLVFARRAVEQPATEEEALKFKLELMRTDGSETKTLFEPDGSSPPAPHGRRMGRSSHSPAARSSNASSTARCGWRTPTEVMPRSSPMDMGEAQAQPGRPTADGSPSPATGT
jgi:Tol biopolymer transport system component